MEVPLVLLKRRGGGRDLPSARRIQVVSMATPRMYPNRGRANGGRGKRPARHCPTPAPLALARHSERVDGKSWAITRPVRQGGQGWKAGDATGSLERGAEAESFPQLPSLPSPSVTGVPWLVHSKTGNAVRPEGLEYYRRRAGSSMCVSRRFAMSHPHWKLKYLNSTRNTG